MKSLINIYNGILGDIDSNITNMDSNMTDIKNTYFERILTILSESGNLNTNQKNKFRKFLSDNISQCKYVNLHIPKSIKDKLIVLSYRTLKNKEFEGIPSNSKEYDFQIGMGYQILLRSAPIISSFVKDEMDINDCETIHLNKNTTIGKYNNMKICLHKNTSDDNMLYIWFDNCRLFINFLKSEFVSTHKDVRKLF